jgi:hypothetical protein
LRRRLRPCVGRRRRREAKGFGEPICISHTDGHSTPVQLCHLIPA